MDHFNTAAFFQKVLTGCLILLFYCFLPIFAQEGSPDQGETPDFASQAPVTNRFIVRREAGEFSSNLPILIIDTDGQRIPDQPRITAWMGIIDNGHGARNSLDDPYNGYEGQISIEIRGNSSQEFPKKSYALETQTESGDNNNVSLLEMPEENDWILYAPYSDKSLMRNVLTFQLARDIGQYAPRTRFCELFLNGDYQGIYVLMEKIKRDKNRVNIAKLTPQDVSGDALTGGYILKLDWEDPKSQGWYSPIDGSLFHYHHPQKEDLLPVQKEYIKDFITQFETVLDGNLYLDPVQGYRRYIDMESFFDYFISAELAHNADSYALSTFMYKDRDSRDHALHMGPQWDFNLAYGNQDEGPYGSPQRWSWEYPLDPNSFWWERFLSDTIFTNQLKERYADLRNDVLDEDRILSLIDSTANALDEAQQRNFQRWPVLGEWVWPNAYVGDTYQDEIDYLKDFIHERLQWLDDHFPGLSAEGPDPAGPGSGGMKGYAIQTYPNPFYSSTHFQFDITYPGQVRITIYNVLGKKVKTLLSAYQNSGVTTVIWDRKDSRGVSVPGGVYFYVFTVDWEIRARKKIVVL
jgi:hypothetical protein